MIWLAVLGYAVCAAGVVILLRMLIAHWRRTRWFREHRTERYDSIFRIAGYRGANGFGWFEYVWSDLDDEDPATYALKRKERWLLTKLIALMICAAFAWFLGSVALEFAMR